MRATAFWMSSPISDGRFLSGARRGTCLQRVPLRYGHTVGSTETQTYILRTGESVVALSDLNCMIILFVSLLLIASPTAVGAQILGSTPELSFVPDHGVLGVLVIVKGTGWNAPPEGYCRILGAPVGHHSCKVVCQGRTCEPAGDFTVADVPAGRYSVKVQVDASGYVPLHFAQWFTVDTATTTTLLTPALGTSASTTSLRTTYRSSPLASALSTTVEHSIAGSMIGGLGTQEREGFALVGLVVVASIAYVFVRRTQRNRSRREDGTRVYG
jgi:hypothetical protein